MIIRNGTSDVIENYIEDPGFALEKIANAQGILERAAQSGQDFSVDPELRDYILEKGILENIIQNVQQIQERLEMVEEKSLKK